MEVSLPAAHRLPRRTSSGDEFIQEPASPMGEGPDSNCNQIASSNSQKFAPMENQGRSILPPHSEYFLPPDDCAFVPASAGHDRPVQPGLVSDALHRSAAMAGFDSFGLNFLFDFAKGALSGLENAAEVPAFPDVRGNWSFCQ